MTRSEDIMKPGDIVILNDHLPLLTGTGLRAGSRWAVDSVYQQQGAANLADRSGAIVACCVPLSRLRPVPFVRREPVAPVSDEDF